MYQKKMASSVKSKRNPFVRTFSVVVITLIIVLIHLTSINSFVTEENSFVVLKTRDSGTFVGVKEEVTGSGAKNESEGTVAELSEAKVYYVFRGVPYAKPPLDNLRWKVRIKQLFERTNLKTISNCA